MEYTHLYLVNTAPWFRVYTLEDPTTNSLMDLGNYPIPNLKEVGLLDRLDGYKVSGLIKELGINILSNLKEVGLLDKMGSNNVERIIEDYNFDKDVLLKLNEFDLLYNVDINFIKRSFVKELKAGLAINPDIYNTNNMERQFCFPILFFLNFDNFVLS